MSNQIIRERDTGGNLVRAGYSWFEQRDGVMAWALMLMGMCGLGGIVGFIAIFAQRTTNDTILMVAITAACAAAVLFGKRSISRSGWRSRTLVFDANGAITAPEGLAGQAEATRLRATLNDVASIERERYGNASRIMLHTHGGDIIVVGTNIMVQEEAQKVAVQLSLAVKEMREALGAGPGAVRPSRQAQQLID